MVALENYGMDPMPGNLTANRIQYLEQLMVQFPDLPPEVFFKEDLLRLGLALGWENAAALGEDSYQRKSYFIFSFDRTPIEKMAQRENVRAPEEIALTGGPRGLRPT